MRFVSCAFARLAPVLVLGLTIAAPTRAAPWEAASALVSAPAPPGLRAVRYDGWEDANATLDRLERAGFRVAVALPPRVFYVLDSDRGQVLPAGFAFRDAAPAAPPDALDPDRDLFGGRDDALPPLVPRAAMADSRTLERAPALQGLPFGARWFDTSEFMIGRVAVSVLFPESDGTTDPNRYNWTPALLDSIVRSAVRGLARWSVFAARRGVPVTFALEVHPGLATRYEPINRTVSEEENWIQDALTGFLGYKSDAITLAYDVANGARSRLGAQWSAIIFAVQDDSSATGTFPDGSISHARLGGPYFVTPVKNGSAAFQGASLDTYMEHEMAHIFWALDEHFPSTGWWSCSLTTGYLNVPNSNSVVPAPGYCGTPPAQCLMKGNYPDSACVYTEGQIGWADRNQDGVPDLLETRAAVFPDSDQYRAVAGSQVTLRGRALEIPLANQNPYHFFSGDSISIATVDSVLYRIDGGPANLALPSDGAYDSGREYFTATLPLLPPGDYVIDWEARNSNGLRSTNNAITTLSLRASSSPAGVGGGQEAAAGMSLRFGPTPSRGSVRFALRAAPGSRGWGTIHDVHGREIARWRLVTPGSGTVDWTWSGRVAGGAALPSGLYFLSVELDGAVLKRRLVISH